MSVDVLLSLLDQPVVPSQSFALISERKCELRRFLIPQVERVEFSIIYLKLCSAGAASYRAEEAVKNIHNSTLCYSQAGAVRGRDSG